MAPKVDSKKVVKGPPWWKSSRYLLAMLAAIGYSHFFLQRVNLSMAIVCMVNHTAVDIQTTEQERKESMKLKPEQRQKVQHKLQQMDLMPSEITDGDGYQLAWNETESTTLLYTDSAVEKPSGQGKGQSQCSMNDNKSDREDGDLVWGKETQGIILGGLYWGYALIQLPSQRIIQAVGSKYVSLFSVVVMSTMTMLGPVAARLDPWALMSIRIVQGFASALGVPAIYAMWGQWAPPEERTKLMSICFSGSMLANAIVYPTSGLLCRYGFAGGWPSVFYVFGIVGYVWCILWAICVYETPATHPRIHPEEKEFIITSIGTDTMPNRKGSVPWLKILKSPPVWAIVFAQLGYDYAFFMLLAVLPQYMREVLKFNIESNGLYTMMPHIFHFIFTNIWGLISASIMNKGLMSVTKVRKLSTFIGDVIPAALYIIISFLDCDHAILVVILMTCAIGVSGTNMQGFLVNPYDIAPKYATAILCLSNTVAVASGIVSPFLVAAMTRDKTREQWQTVFFVTAGISMACLLFYFIFGDGKEMEWARSEIEIDVEIDAPDAEANTNIMESNLNSKVNAEKNDAVTLLRVDLSKDTGAGYLKCNDVDFYKNLLGGLEKLPNSEVTSKLAQEHGCGIDIRVKVTSDGECDVNMKLIQGNNKASDSDDGRETIV